MAYGNTKKSGRGGPAKTTMGGTQQNPGNLGKTTKGTRNNGSNKDAAKGIARARINPGPGGSQRP